MFGSLKIEFWRGIAIDERKVLSKHSVHISERVKYSHGSLPKLSVMRLDFNLWQYINKLRYLDLTDALLNQ